MAINCQLILVKVPLGLLVIWIGIQWCCDPNADAENLFHEPFRKQPFRKGTFPVTETRIIVIRGHHPDESL